MIGTPGRLRAELAFFRAGSGAPVLLIPGLLSSPSVWKEVISALVSHYEVISMDLKAHLSPGRRGVADQAQHWQDLLDRLELPSAHVIAHGSGSPVATMLALETPSRALSLALVNPVIPRSESPALQHAWHLQMILQWLETGHGRTVRRPEHIHALEQVLSQQTLARFAEPPHTASPDSQLGADPDFNGLADLDLPVLAINGGDEAPEVCDLTRTLYGRAPHFRYRQIPGARQNCLREMPGLLARVLEEFLQDAENPVMPT